MNEYEWMFALMVFTSVIVLSMLITDLCVVYKTNRRLEKFNKWYDENIGDDEDATNCD